MPTHVDDQSPKFRHMYKSFRLLKIVDDPCNDLSVVAFAVKSQDIGILQ